MVGICNWGLKWRIREADMLIGWDEKRAGGWCNKESQQLIKIEEVIKDVAVIMIATTSYT